MVTTQGKALRPATSDSQLEIELFQGNSFVLNRPSDPLVFATANVSFCLRSFSCGAEVYLLVYPTLSRIVLL